MINHRILSGKILLSNEYSPSIMNLKLRVKISKTKCIKLNDVIVSIILKMLKVIPNNITVMLNIYCLLSIEYIYKLNNQRVLLYIYIYYKTCCSSRCSNFNHCVIKPMLNYIQLRHVMFILRKFLSKLLWLKMATGNRIQRMWHGEPDKKWEMRFGFMNSDAPEE